MKKWCRWLIFLLVLLLPAFTGCTVQPPEDDFTLDSMGDGEFIVEPDYGVVGKVNALNRVSLSFPIDGQLVDLKVNEGDQVVAGQELARLDASSLEREILNAQAAVAVAKANYERATATAHEALIKEAQLAVSAASADNVFGSSQETAQALDVQAALARLNYLKSLPLPEDVAVAQAQLDEAEVRLKSVEEQLQNTLLVSPIEGTVIKVLAQEGEYVYDGQVIVQLGDFSQMVVEAYANDADIIGVEIGDRAEIRLTALPEVQLFATVASIMPNDLEPDKGNFLIKLNLDGPVDRRYWGMAAEVYFEE